jgi:PDZ domain-containing secreted protein
MFDENEIVRLKSIYKKLNDITTIVERHNSVSNALNDIEGQPAILMLFVAIAEQLNKLKKHKGTSKNPFQNF